MVWIAVWSAPQITTLRPALGIGQGCSAREPSLFGVVPYPGTGELHEPLACNRSGFDSCA